MTQGNTSRRVMLGSGAAVVGMALLGRIAVGRNGKAPAADGIRVVRGIDTNVLRPIASQRDDWQRRIGERFQFAAETGAFLGTLIEVRAESIGGSLPAGVRAHPFTMVFAVDRAVAPAQDGLFVIDQAVEGLNRVFVTRGVDRGDQAILAALFA